MLYQAQIFVWLLSIEFRSIYLCGKHLSDWTSLIRIQQAHFNGGDTEAQMDERFTQGCFLENLESVSRTQKSVLNVSSSNFLPATQRCFFCEWIELKTLSAEAYLCIGTKDMETVGRRDSKYDENMTYNKTY